MKKTFVTLFPICENVHLIKDIGQIPYFMHKVCGFDSTVATYKISQNYSHIEGEVKGLKIDFIENKGKRSFVEKGILEYIRKNAKKMDVLNLYHFSKDTFVYGLWYKLFNPKGFLYFKIDAYNDMFAEGKTIKHSKKKIKNYFLKCLESRFLKKTDLISIETKEGERLIKLMYPFMSDKLICFPLGANDLFLSGFFKGKIKTFKEKENIILTTGRIGLDLKNHEMILRALQKVNMKDWKMVFVGPVTPTFKKYFEEFSELKEKVIFTGEVTDRVRLYEWYNRSKIFCMTSFRESFSLSIVEALYFGNYIIGTEGVMSMKDITDNEKYGVIIKDSNAEQFAENLQRIINNQNKIENLCEESMKFSHENFVWSKLIKRINERIK